MAESSPSLPSHPSPAARAFFTALDQQQQVSENKEDGGGAGTPRRCSAFVQKKLTTLGWRNRHSQEEWRPVSCLNFNVSIRQVQRGEIEGTYGTGATVWPASIVLLKYLEHLSTSENCNDIVNLVENCNVVDLGSGTAVTSVAAAILGAKNVLCTDGCENVVNLARDNLRHTAKEIADQTKTTKTPSDINEGEDDGTIVIGECNLTTQVLWWGKDSVESPFFDRMDADVVIVADCVLPKLYPIAPLVQAIDELLVKPQSLAILSYEHRYYPEYHPKDKFKELAIARGLTVETVPQGEHHPIYNVDDIEIWKVYRRGREE